MLSDERTLSRAVPAHGGLATGPARVFLLIGQLGLGGTEKQVALLARGLHGQGVDVRVLVLFKGGAWESDLNAAGVPVVHLGFHRRVSGWRMLPGNAAAFSRFVTYLRRARPDVLHAFLYHSYVTAAPAARLARVPVLVAGRRSLGDYKQERRALLAAERAATSMTDLLVANAHSVADDTRRNEGVRPDKLTVIYNGLPDSAFAPAVPAAIDTDLPVVLSVANLKRYKGHRYLLDAVARLRPGLPCTLVLAGEGQERPALERQAGRLGIDVRFLGARTDIDRLLARADAVVLPSLHEGMSNAVMEAMAAGLPVVASDVGGTAELLRDRGVLVPPADAAALAAALERVLTDRSFATRLGQSARAWSRAHLHVSTMVDRHVRIYGELLERRCAE
ncbi:glycosyltransferase [Actinomadura sp. HBU206391]|uniref:glycosyltransferase n=1 Tax=Actinomadura sp. HBU206391 TaxID=2731692 RepID=UPI001650BBE9|nr:glycosyltransferase [Actinomadura sp. HBU206391]